MVKVTPSVTTQGQTVLIEGTVTDQSPAVQTSEKFAPQTPSVVPCVSDESMGTYMEYLYLQKSLPNDVTGVPVTLMATDSNGNTINIGTVQSDLTGFRFAWTPPNSDLYTIRAVFAGTNAYGSSWAASGVSVSQAPVASATPTASTISFDAVNNTVMSTVIGGVIAIIIAVAIVGLLVLRKRP